MPAADAHVGTVVVIDDSDSVRHSLRALLEAEGLRVMDYATAETYLADSTPPRGDCLVVTSTCPA